MNDLVAFLQARFAEDETVAREVLPSFSPSTSELMIVGDDEGFGTISIDSARVLAEVAMRRGILDEHPPAQLHPTWLTIGWEPGQRGQVPVPGEFYCPRCSDADEGTEMWPCPTTRLLALPYAEHPECHPSWLPPVPDRT